MFALVLVYNREQRYDDALRVLQELRRLYPRNRLVLLEAGSTALRAGRPEQAEAVLTEGLGDAGRNDRRETFPAKKRCGATSAAPRASRSDEATPRVADLQSAASPEAQAWVRGRARVELARVALQRGDRAGAAGEARQAESLCEQGQDPVCLDEAKKLLRSS